jgi:hypothetical protein
MRVYIVKLKFVNDLMWLHLFSLFNDLSSFEVAIKLVVFFILLVDCP